MPWATNKELVQEREGWVREVESLISLFKTRITRDVETAEEE